MTSPGAYLDTDISWVVLNAGELQLLSRGERISVPNSFGFPVELNGAVFSSAELDWLREDGVVIDPVIGGGAFAVTVLPQSAGHPPRQRLL